MSHKGYISRQKLDRSTCEWVTVSPVHANQNALDVRAQVFSKAISTANAAEAGTTVSAIKCTGIEAGCRRGDIIRVTQAGALYMLEVPVESVTTDWVTLGEDLPSALGVGHTFDVLRLCHAVVDTATGEIAVTLTLDKGAGATGANTLRNVPATDAVHTLAVRHEADATPLSVRPGNGADFAAFGAGVVDATVQRTTPATDSPHLLNTRHEAAATPLAAQISNGAAFADFGAGANGANVLRTTPATDATHLLNTRHEAAATPLAVELSNGANFAAFGAGANAADVIRTTPATDAPHLLNTRHEAAATPVATRIGNGAAFAAFGSGANAADVLRTTPATDAEHLLAARHEAVGTPLSVRLGDALTFFDSVAIAAAQFAQNVFNKIATTLSVVVGWDGTNHREIAVDTAGNLKTAAYGRAKANAPYRNDYSSSSVTTAAYTEAVASTTSATNRLQIFDSSGQTMKLATGGAGAEVDIIYIPPGGIDVDYAIAAGTRLSLRAVSANATAGEIVMNMLT